MTVRPDVPACCFELVTLGVALRYLRRPATFNLLLVAFFAYVAWSFKQTNISVLGGLLIFFVLRRDYRPCAIAFVVFSALVALTYILHDRLYAYDTLFAQKSMGFVPKELVQNLLSAFIKFPFLPFTAVLLIAFKAYRFWKSDINTTHPFFAFLTITFTFSFVWCTVTCGKSGARDNYFFTPCVIALLILIVLWQEEAIRSRLFRKSDSESNRLLQIGLSACSLLIVLQISALFWVNATGIGRSWFKRLNFPAAVDFKRDDLRYRTLRAALLTLPAPAYADEGYGNLPWIQTRPPYFVLACGYHYDMDKNISFKEGGMDGLLQKGYFKTLAIPDYYKEGFVAGHRIPATYRLLKTDAYYRYYTYQIPPHS